jgi:hypothetical protein
LELKPITEEVRPESAVAVEASLLGSFAVALTEGTAAFIVVLSFVLLTIGHTENVESALFVVAFAGVLPLAILATWWRNVSLTAQELSVLGGLDAAALALALVACQTASAGARALLVAGIMILAGSISLAGPMRFLLGPIARRVPPNGWLVVLSFFVAGLAFMPPWVYSSKGFVAAFPVSILIAALATSVLRPLRAVAVVDAGAALLIAATILDVFFWGAYYVSFTHNFYLGPVNEVLHGRTILVDVFAQYGVAVMYFLAGLFSLIPIGYGTFALVLSALTILEFVMLYAIVRIAGRSQLVAVLASAVAIVFVLDGQLQSFDVYPSTGPLRFGLPFVVILLETLAARASDGGHRLRLASAAVTALASLWSFETFAYTLAAYLGVAALETVADRTSWRDAVRDRLLPLVAFIVPAHALFAVGTRLASGSWPAWGTYLDIIRLYSVKGFGSLPITPWSPGLLLAGMLFASALLVALFAIRKPVLVRQRLDLFVALAGSTAFAILAFTYYLGRSHPNNLHHVAPPAIMACALWLCLLVELADVVPTLRFTLFAVTVWAAFMLVDGSHRELDAKWSHSALGSVLADGPSALARRVEFLASRPPVDARAPQAVVLLDFFDAGKSRSLVLVEPELTTEVLLRANRGNAIPIATPPQDITFPTAVSHALSAVRALPVGTIMIADSRYLAEKPYSNPAPTLTELGVWQVRRWFDLRTLTQAANNLTVSRLVARLEVPRAR